jgi:hypothetical protein
MERQFKVGERVEIIKSSIEDEVGMTGLITYNDGSSSLPLKVVFDLNNENSEDTWCNHNDLKLIEEPKREFKVGDRVATKHNESRYNDNLGVIVRITDSHMSLKVEYYVPNSDKSDYDWYTSKELELIEEHTSIKDTRLERLEDLLKAVNMLGGLGLEVALKITVEIDGKKIEL